MKFICMYVKNKNSNQEFRHFLHFHHDFESDINYRLISCYRIFYD